jgi:hypothetical protein
MGLFQKMISLYKEQQPWVIVEKKIRVKKNKRKNPSII